MVYNDRYTDFFALWSASVSSVHTLEEEGLWICIEGVPYHLWSVDLFHKIVSSFAELLEVDMSNDLVCFYGSASLKVRLLGRDMPNLVHLSFLRKVYTICFNRVFDICALPQKFGPLDASFTMGFSDPRGRKKSFAKANRAGVDIPFWHSSIVMKPHHTITCSIHL